MKNIVIFVLTVAYCSIVLGQAKWIHQSDAGQAESPIAINPTNPDNIIITTISFPASGKVIDVYYTLNGGDSWSVHEAVSEAGGADPQIAFDGDGIAYLIYQIRDTRGLYLHTSDDGGLNWSERKTIVEFNSSDSNIDRPWLAISPVRNSNHKFRIYVSYTRDYGADRWIEIRKSEDSDTFVTLDYKGQGTDDLRPHGSAIAVGKNGDLTLAWANIPRVSDNPVKEIRIAHSNSANFNYPVISVRLK